MLIIHFLFCKDVPSTPGKPLIMKFDSRSVVLSWSPPLHVHHSQVLNYIIHILEGEDTDWAEHEVKQLIIYKTKVGMSVNNQSNAQVYWVIYSTISFINDSISTKFEAKQVLRYKMKMKNKIS